MAKLGHGGGCSSVTALVYGFIRDSQHSEAIRFLKDQVMASFPDCQASLSLLAYCHYHLGNYNASASVYQKLVRLHPSEQKYQIYHAQSLYKASMLDEAEKACYAIDGNLERVENLKACIKFEQEDTIGSRQIWENNSEENLDAVANLGCCLYKVMQEEAYEEALEKFEEALSAEEFQPDLAYNRALCFYKLKRYVEALKVLEEIIESGLQEYPELRFGSHVEGMDLCSVGNSHTLKSSKLVDAFNLKGAIEYATGNIDAAKEALNEMPPRAEEELDSVTLHNQALFFMDVDPAAGFRKLNFLLQNPPFPPETFRNLLIFYCKPSGQLTDLAALLMEENPELTSNVIPQDLKEFLDAIILMRTSVVESYQKLSELAVRYGESMRRLIKQMQDTHISGNHNAHRKFLLDYERLLQNYTPVIMAMAKIFWDKGNYMQVDRIFQQSSDFCSEHSVWRLNVAHNFFMQDNRYLEAIQYYEPIVKRSVDNILSAPPIVLANLCVSYIMTNQNDEAENLMRKIEKEEERAQYQDEEKEGQFLHLCIVNLVIGTLYCAKQNFEFGISRIIKSLDPIDKKLDSKTWFYTKRCFLALADNLAKQMITLRDSTYVDLEEFLDIIDINSRKLYASNDDYEIQGPEGENGRVMICHEARLLKKIFFNCRE